MVGKPLPGRPYALRACACARHSLNSRDNTIMVSPRFFLVFLVSVTTPMVNGFQTNRHRLRSDIFDNNVWLMGEKFLDYSTDCETLNFMTLSPNGSVFTFYDLVEGIPEAHFHLSPPGYKIKVAMLNEEQQDEVVVILQEYHMTILRFGTFHTVSIPVQRASSLLVVKALACVIPDVPGPTNITCVNAINLTVKNCSFLVQGGSQGYSDCMPIYHPTPLAFIVEPDYIHKFNVSNGCLQHVQDSPKPGQYHYGHHSWFSNNGTTLFLDNGLTVSAATLKPGAIFNASSNQSFSYNSFSQSPTKPYEILGLRTDISNRVIHYSWPQLEPVGSQNIPEPKKVKATIMSTHEVHSCSESAEYAVATYMVHGGSPQTGVAYLTFF